MSKIKSIATSFALLGALACYGETTLASWTFETNYELSSIDDKNTLLTPIDGDTYVSGAKWFKTDFTPHILPEIAVGNVGDYELTGYAENRYWQLIEGYQTPVFRIENAGASNEGITDITDPSQHKAYFEVSFPTKGYKGISIDLAIAPGNNTVTPFLIAVSTDGGETWNGAGSVDSSGTWFTYDDKSFSLSANNKDKVKVRLLPSTGETNWNLKYIAVNADETVESGAVNAPESTATWELQSADYDINAATNPDGLLSVASLSVGSKLTSAGLRTDSGVKRSQFQPTEKVGTNSVDNALTFTIVPKKGLTMKPVKMSFKACRVGTNGGKFDVGVTANGGEEKLVDTGVTPQLAKDAPYMSDHEYDLSSLGDASKGLVARIYIKELDVTKQYAFSDVVITVDINGELVAVPVYTLNLAVGTPGAGSVSCVPGGAEFDEGTQLTVSASENFGYHFTSWTDASGAVVSESNPYTFTITENTSLTANYSQTPVYALNVAVEGGANDYLVQFNPQGNVVDGVHYYEEGTDVSLSATNNRIITFTNWEDNSTAADRIVKMDGEKNLTATFSAADFIVGWDFYNDSPNSQRAADYKADTENAGLLSLRNADGTTTTWLTRGVNNGAENGKWGARIWKVRTDGYYFEASFSTIGYTNINVAASLGVSYNTYKTFNAQWSSDGENFTTFGTYTLAPGWTTEEFALPAEAAGQTRIWVRYMPEGTELVGNATDYDGLCIADLYVLADSDAADDDTAPSVVSIIPADGFDGASATGSVIVTFDEKIVAGSGSATLNGETLTMTVSGKTAVFPYAGLDYATSYTFSMPAGIVTDRSGNPSAAFTSTFTTLERTQPEARLFDAIVAADGSGDYTSLQDAIDAAPDGRVVPWLIFVKNGNYKEHIDIPKAKSMLHIIGQDRDKAVILDDKLCGGDNALHVSVGATVVVNSNDCLFENITLENSYGHEKQAGPQALALNTIGDRTIFNNVAMLSYQDTWITPSTSNYRAYVRNSFIEGAVDFIYNSGNIYIDNTTLYINRKSGGYIVAPSHAADVEWGYVFNNCTITAPGKPSDTDVWLGRPWHNFPKTVFLNTRAEVTIPAAGWYETMGGLPALWADWNTVDGNGNPVDLSQRRDTYYYIDSATGQKVYGKAKNYLTDEEAAEYTIKNVLSGSDNWQPVIKTESCDAPEPVIDNGLLSWNEVPYAICYLVTKGDEVIGFTTEPSIEVPLSRADEGVYAVQAVNEFGGLSAKGYSTISSALDIISDGVEAEIIGIYDIQGRSLPAAVKGVNIIMMRSADGSVSAEKILVR